MPAGAAGEALGAADRGLSFMSRLGRARGRGGEGRLIIGSADGAPCIRSGLVNGVSYVRFPCVFQELASLAIRVCLATWRYQLGPFFRSVSTALLLAFK